MTDLNPSSRVLKHRYFRSDPRVQRACEPDSLDTHPRSLNILHTEDFQTQAAVAGFSWISGD
jgi:hypothetical protein